MTTDSPLSLLMTDDFAQRGWRCPSEEVLGAFVERTLREGERAHVEAHISSCEHCLAQVAYLLQTQDAEPPAVPADLLRRVQVPQEKVAPLWGRWAPASVAVATVAIAAAIVLGPDVAAPPQVTPPAVTTAPAPAVTSSGSVEKPAVKPPTEAPRAVRGGVRGMAASPVLLEPAAGARVHPDTFKLRWSAVPQALYYEVRIATEDGALVWKTRVEHAEGQVPAEAGLAAGTSYFVWVRAFLPEGKVVRTSAVPFTVE